MKIENITVRDYFNTELDTSDYDMFITSMKPINKLCGKVCDYDSLTFDDVQYIKSVLSEPNYNDLKGLFLHIYDIRGNFDRSRDEVFLDESIFTLFSAQMYLRNWIEKIVDRERKQFTSKPDVKSQMINANERLKAFSHLLTKMDLAMMFNKTPEEIGRWKYITVFTILVAQKRRNDVQRDYNEIK